MPQDPGAVHMADGVDLPLLFESYLSTFSLPVGGSYSFVVWWSMLAWFAADVSIRLRTLTYSSGYDKKT